MNTNTHKPSTLHSSRKEEKEDDSDGGAHEELDDEAAVVADGSELAREDAVRVVDVEHGAVDVVVDVLQHLALVREQPRDLREHRLQLREARLGLPHRLCARSSRGRRCRRRLREGCCAEVDAHRLAAFALVLFRVPRCPSTLSDALLGAGGARR